MGLVEKYSKIKPQTNTPENKFNIKKYLKV